MGNFSGRSISSFSLGTRIRELRLKKGITQNELSKGICTASMISQIESDRVRPSYKILISIAERLDVPLEKLLADVDLNLEYVSNYKMARAMVAAKEYASAIPLLLELLEMPRGQISTVDILYALGECYLHTSQLEKAENTFEQVHELAALRKDHYLLAALLNNIARIEVRRKRYQLAAYQWHKALNEIGKMEEVDISLQAMILFQLGNVHKTLGSMNESISFYEQAGRLLDGVGNPYDMANVFLGLSITYRKLGDLDRATEYSEKAAAIHEVEENMLTVVKTKVQTAALYGQMQRKDEALPMLEDAIQRFHELGACEEESIAIVELAKLKLQNGTVDEAEQLCHQARLLLPELHPYSAWVDRILGKIALLRNERFQAIERFHKAAACFKQMDDVTAWDETMYEVAQLHLEENDFIRACGIMDNINRYTRQVLVERGIVL